MYCLHWIGVVKFRFEIFLKFILCYFDRRVVAPFVIRVTVLFKIIFVFIILSCRVIQMVPPKEKDKPKEKI